MAVLSGRANAVARAALAAGVALLLAGAPERAQAQGLFDVLRSIFGGPPPGPRGGPPLLLDGFPRDGERPPAAHGGPAVAYCVRLCDGRYFPLPRNAGAPAMTPAQVCSAMCPAAKTQVFHGSQIDHAVSSSGGGYAKLQNAFLYRERLVEDCSCTGAGGTGLARIDIEADPTLRPGDIVVTADGPVVFKGSRRPPHRADDFTPAESYRGLPKSLRRQLSNMRIQEDAGPVPPAAGPEAEAPDEETGPRADASPATPVAEAFATFRR